MNATHRWNPYDPNVFGFYPNLTGQIQIIESHGGLCTNDASGLNMIQLLNLAKACLDIIIKLGETPSNDKIFATAWLEMTKVFSICKKIIAANTENPAKKPQENVFCMLMVADLHRFMWYYCPQSGNVEEYRKGAIDAYDLVVKFMANFQGEDSTELIKWAAEQIRVLNAKGPRNDQKFCVLLREFYDRLTANS